MSCDQLFKFLFVKTRNILPHFSKTIFFNTLYIISTYYYVTPTLLIISTTITNYRNKNKNFLTVDFTKRR